MEVVVNGDPAQPDGAAPLPPASPPTPLAQPRGAEVHAPVLRRLKLAGRNPAPFRGKRTRGWFAAGVTALTVLALLPFAAPELSSVTERLATLLSLIFLMASVGLWLNMGSRSFVVASTFVVVLYALTFWTHLALQVQDFFVIALVVSFAIFILAGFNLVFVLEEIVYDTHVLLHLRWRGWLAAPSIYVLALTIGLPMWARRGGPELPVLWSAAAVCTLLLASWWFLRLFNRLDDRRILPELHLFVVGALAAAALADGITYLQALRGILPSLVAYLALIGTWVYASYTTLQRTHFLLRGDNAYPWVAILLGASFAILAHAQVLFQAGGSGAVADLVHLRMDYLIAGVWLGIAFYVLRGLWRILRFLRSQAGLGARSRRVAGQAAQVAEGLLGTERLVEEGVTAFFRSLDQLLPGTQRPPRHIGWELDPEGTLRVLEDKDGPA